MPLQEDSADAFVLLSTERDQQTGHKTSFSTITLEMQRHPNCGDEEVGSISKGSKATRGFAARTWYFRLMKYRKGDVSYLVRGFASSSLALQERLRSCECPASTASARSPAGSLACSRQPSEAAAIGAHPDQLWARGGPRAHRFQAGCDAEGRTWP